MGGCLPGPAFAAPAGELPTAPAQQAVGENIWKGSPGTGGNFQANEAPSAQPGTPTLPSAPGVIADSATGTRGNICALLRGLVGSPGVPGSRASPFPFSLSLLGGPVPCTCTDALRVLPKTVTKGEAAPAVRSSAVSPEFLIFTRQHWSDTL